MAQNSEEDSLYESLLILRKILEGQDLSAISAQMLLEADLIPIIANSLNHDFALRIQKEAVWITSWILCYGDEVHAKHMQQFGVVQKLFEFAKQEETSLREHVRISVPRK